MVAKSPQLVVWSPEGRMNGSQESPTGSLKSRRKDGNQESPIGSLEPSNKIERNNGDLLHILELTGNDG